MRQLENVQVGHVTLIVQNVDIAGPRPIRNVADAPQAVLDGIQALQQLLRRKARTNEDDRIHERILVLIVGRFAFVKRRDVDNQRVRHLADIADGLVQLRDLRLALFARLRNQRNVRTKAQQRIRTQLLQRIDGGGHIVRADDACPQLARQQRLCGTGRVALPRLGDLVQLADIAFAGNGRHHGIAHVHQLMQIAHELDRLRDGLREAGTGVQADAVVGDARSLEFGCPFGKRIADFPHYVVVLR